MTTIELISKDLINTINQLSEKANGMYLLVSFIMKSGVNLIYDILAKLLREQVEIKILCGDYLFITEPVALDTLLKLDGDIEIRMFKSQDRSFHPKAYFIQNEQNSLIIGSSNLSKSALTTGIEWNLHVYNENKVFEEALHNFNKLFYSENTSEINSISINEYHQEYLEYHKKHSILRFCDDNEDETEDEPFEEISQGVEITPQQIQIEALAELENLLNEEYDKAMVVIATGLGKTYLSAFFAQKFSNILFIAHRNEILIQAKRSYERVITGSEMGIFIASTKEISPIIFASIFTISTKKNLTSFAPDYFDLVVIDEFHHAAAKSYQKILNYFKPKFLLGLTATPDRLDGKDIYNICDGNIAYEIDFIEGINRGYLSPFHYFGVEDEIDYSTIKLINNKYNQAELVQQQIRENIINQIYSNWLKYKQSKSVGFCSSITQAEVMEEYFSSKGVKVLSLTSKTEKSLRRNAIKDLEDGKIEIIFTVDLFNEGVDIPSLDTLLFIRPTESVAIYTQQIGRGLRLFKGKEKCVIIDFIGNYQNVDLKLKLLGIDTSKPLTTNPPTITLPSGCEIDFGNLDIIDLMNRIKRARLNWKETLVSLYFELKNELGRRPTYLELHLKGKGDIEKSSIKKGYKHYWNSYHGFLFENNELNENEISTYYDFKDFIENVENTSMVRSYKMVVLMAMINRGIDNWYKEITPEEVAPFFHQYLTEKEYRKSIDFSGKKHISLLTYDQSKVAKLISEMPMTKWASSSNGHVYFENNRFGFNIDHDKINIHLFNFLKEIAEYRLHYHFERKSKR
ncbi:MAG: DEAD/DEAH box helicase family protein [Candidatus Heimdallarchaeota archaeon]|nr:DEAD/DEAH box helicase family protein [Candidatus Heimdallarchaeota archaeon]